MKTFTQFNEDIEQRRKQLRQRQLDQMAAYKERATSHQSAQRKRQERQREREELKQEIKRELHTEQTPTMKPNPYNVMIARQQAKRKSTREIHAQQEMGAEARAQNAAKRERLRAIMSR